MLFLPHYQPPYHISSKSDKKTKLEIFTFGRFWLVGLVGRKMVVGVSNSFHIVFASLLAPIPNFIQIGQKKTLSKKFSLLVDFGWLGWQVEKRLQAFKTHSILFLPHFQPPCQILSKLDEKQRSQKLSLLVEFGWSGDLILSCCCPIFIQIGQETQKLEIFTFGRFWLVGLVGQKMVVSISNSFYLVFSPCLAPLPNFIQIGRKTWKLEISTFGQFWWVGLVG